MQKFNGNGRFGSANGWTEVKRRWSQEEELLWLMMLMEVGEKKNKREKQEAGEEDGEGGEGE